MRLIEGSKVRVTANKSYVEYAFIGGAWFPVLLGFLILAAIFVPYFILICRDNLHPFLPLVSQAAGSPPQSGIFSILLCLTVLVCFIGMHLMYMAVRLHQEKIEFDDVRQNIELLNKAMLIPAHLGILGIMIVSGYPLDFHRHNEDWMEVTVYPHLAGAVSLFVGGSSYCILFTHIMSIIKPEKTSLHKCRQTIIAIIMLAAAMHAFTVYRGFLDEYNDENRLKTCSFHRTQYNVIYNISSFSEWVLLICFVCFFITAREEAKEFTFSMNLTFNDSTCDPLSSSSLRKKKNMIMCNGTKESNAKNIDNKDEKVTKQSDS